jgi:hypothetical protein
MCVRILLVICLALRLVSVFGQPANDNQRKFIKFAGITIVKSFPVPFSRIGLGDDGTVYLTTTLIDGDVRFLRVSQPNVGIQLIMHRGYPYLLDRQSQLLSFQTTLKARFRSFIRKLFSRMPDESFGIRDAGDFFTQVVATHVKEVLQDKDHHDFQIYYVDSNAKLRDHKLSELVQIAKGGDCVSVLTRLIYR